MGRIARTIRVNGQNVPFDMKPSDVYDASGQLPPFCLLSGDRLDYHAGNSDMDNLPKALHDALRRAERQGFVFPLHATIKFADGEETKKPWHWCRKRISAYGSHYATLPNKSGLPR